MPPTGGVHKVFCSSKRYAIIKLDKIPLFKRFLRNFPMLGMGIRSLSAYIRKMALDGYCLNLDLPQLRRMAYLLQMCSNNLNQYAKRANESGKIYATDMEDLRQRLDELIDIGRQILSRLAEL